MGLKPRYWSESGPRITGTGRVFPGGSNSQPVLPAPIQHLTFFFFCFFGAMKTLSMPVNSRGVLRGFAKRGWFTLLCWALGLNLAIACYLSAPRPCPAPVWINGVRCVYLLYGSDYYMWYIAAPAGSWGFTRLINDNYQWCRYECDDGQERSAFTGVILESPLCRGSAHYP